MDSLGVFGEAIIGILAAVAQQERIRLSERTKAGLERVRKKGKRLGRPKVVVSASRIAFLREEGRSWAHVAEELGVGEGTVRRAAQTSAKNLVLGS